MPNVICFKPWVLFYSLFWFYPLKLRTYEFLLYLFYIYYNLGVYLLSSILYSWKSKYGVLSEQPI